jgi:hypothetical protein
MILLYEDEDEPMISLLPQKAAFSIIVVIWHHCIVSLCVRERDGVCVGGWLFEREREKKKERERESEIEGNGGR